MSGERRWMNVKGYAFARAEGHYVILARGGKWVGKHLEDDDVALDPIAEARTADDARRIVRALRSTLKGGAQ